MLKTSILAAAIIAASAAGASAQQKGEGRGINPTAFFGIVWNFNGNAGVTAKMLSTNKPNQLAAAGGVTYYFDGSFGCDLGIGVSDHDYGVTATYDFCSPGFQIGVGAIADKPGYRNSGEEQTNAPSS